MTSVHLLDLSRDLDDDSWRFVSKTTEIYRQLISRTACSCTCGEDMCEHINYLLTDLVDSDQIIIDWSPELFDAFNSMWMYLFSDCIFESPVVRDNCPICFDEISQNAKSVKCIFSCKNVFHEKCLEIWLAKKPICPMCRADFQYSQ